VKQKAIDVMFEAGIDIIPVTTVVNGVNDDQVGPILDFVIKNSDRMGGVSFQPVSFTGRDEEISDEDRKRQRYTISHMAHELDRHSGGKIDPYRDWFPLGAMGGLSVLADHLRSLQGPDGPSMGSLACSCHPNCGSSILIVANRKTQEWATITQFFDLWSFIQDVAVICDSARGRNLTVAQVALSFVRNFDTSKAPPGLDLTEFAKLFFNGKMGGVLGTKMREKDWTVLWVGGMWFQDLWTYDFRRTEMCVIPYATQEGEISFCAYNTGVGWRQIVENMHSVAETKEWFNTRGRHQIYAGDRPMPTDGRRKLPVVGNAPKVPLGAHISGDHH
jgi:7,8-dihydro-6-hydroxymethylpterin dimethyltransferase